MRYREELQGGISKADGKPGGAAAAVRPPRNPRDLQMGFLAMSASATVGELVRRMSALLQELTGRVDVRILRRPRPGAAWEPFDGTGEDPSAFNPPELIHSLPDGSEVGISNGGKGNEVHLLLHLFQNVYEGLSRKKSEKELIFSLNQRVLQLNSLIDTGIEITRLEVGSRPHALALVRAASLTNASSGIVRLSVAGQVVEEARFPEAAESGDRAAPEHQISSGFSFGGQTYRFELHDKESRTGTGPFDETDQLLLDAIVRQVHASLENRHLHRQALEKQRIEQDLAVAALIQQRILPTDLPVPPGYDIAGTNIPSKSVGGDYYDCIRLPNGMLLLVVADVAGKGVPAALLVSSLHAYLSAYIETGVSIIDLTKRLNRVIYNASTDDKFITAFFGLLTPETGEMETVNAGHNPAYLLLADGSVREMSTGGVALGMLDLDFPFQSEKFVLGRGERLLLYTDGIPEATNAQLEMYESRTPLKEILLRSKEGSAGEFIRRLMDDIRSFTGDAPQSDDITALFLSRL